MQNFVNGGCQRISGVAASEASGEFFEHPLLRGSGVHKLILDPPAGVFLT